MALYDPETLMVLRNALDEHGPFCRRIANPRAKNPIWPSAY
jgi:hypothetical protein